MRYSYFSDVLCWLARTTPYKCLIYSNRSKVCKQFPICMEDLQDVNYQCGYSFR